MLKKIIEVKRFIDEETQYYFTFDFFSDSTFEINFNYELIYRYDVIDRKEYNFISYEVDCDYTSIQDSIKDIEEILENVKKYCEGDLLK